VSETCFEQLGSTVLLELKLPGGLRADQRRHIACAASCVMNPCRLAVCQIAAPIVELHGRSLFGTLFATTPSSKRGTECRRDNCGGPSEYSVLVNS
jgi:hypothetical protein